MALIQAAMREIGLMTTVHGDESVFVPPLISARRRPFAAK